MLLQRFPAGTAAWSVFEHFLSGANVTCLMPLSAFRVLGVGQEVVL